MAERYGKDQEWPIHKSIPMEKLDLIQSNQVRILNYENPSRFYVYLRQKFSNLNQLQLELQRTMEIFRNHPTSSQYQCDQAIAVLDNHSIWHRATISELLSNSSEVRVYFVDDGREETVSIAHIRPLPIEFTRLAAFAIPCRLYDIYPLNTREQFNWRTDDPVHHIFNDLTSTNVNCKVCERKEQCYYEIEIDIPKIGDLGTYLFKQNLVLRRNMRSMQSTSPQTFNRIPPGFSELRKPVVQNSDIPSFSLQDGTYVITHVYSAIEFYGHSLGRERELEAFHKRLESFYNNQQVNDQSLSVDFLMEGIACAIQHGEKYHRVVIKHRESESRVLVKLVDRGDEMIVDISELLQIEQCYLTIPAFAQPFRLYNYEDSQSSATITRKLKRLILNQRVQITQHLPMIKGFYPVEVKLADNQLVNDIILSNDPIPMNVPPIKPVEKPPTPRINEELPAPPKLLTASTISNRFGRPPSQQRQQQDEPSLTTNGHQPLMSELKRSYQKTPTAREFSTERNGFNRGGGFANRETHDRKTEDTSRFNGDNGDRSHRGGFNGDSGDRSRRGGFNGDSGDRPRRGGFNGDGGVRSYRGGFNGNSGDRSHRGRFAGNRGGHRPINVDQPETMKTFSGWSNAKTSSGQFESADCYKEMDFPKQSFEFVVSHFESFTDFFIQMISNENELSRLTETLQNEYSTAPDFTLSSLKPYQPCLAQSTIDNCWYRALILSTGISKIKIRFIDFGDTHEIEMKNIRQLAKQFTKASPYAYHCTLKTTKKFENLNTNDIINKCAGQNFQGKFDNQTPDKKFILQSDSFEQLFADKSRLSCLIVHIDHDQHQFYIQDDFNTMEKIKSEIVANENLSEDDIQINRMVISTYEDDPYRAIIEKIDGDNIEVYFVDYGNRTNCSKNSLKKCPEQLISYPPQAKCCQLEDDDYLKKLDDIQDSDVTEYSIIHQNENIYTVRLFINHDCLTDLSIQSTATTVKERKRNNEEILSPINNSTSTSLNIKRQKSAIDIHEGILTYVDKTKSIVYLQLLPESDIKIEQINVIINKIVQKNQHNETYNIGDYVIAQFSDDDNYYRAKIESYSSLNDTYSVYFLDYGNIDENVRKDHLYSYSNQLNQFEEQAKAFTLDNLHWTDQIRSILEQKLNETIEFDLIDEEKAIITIKSLLKSQPKTFIGNLSGTTNDSFYLHLLPDADTLICEMGELLQIHPKQQQENVSIWKINDLCIVLRSDDDDHDRYFRGKILSIKDDLFDIQCIDYGNLVFNVKNDHLYLLTNKDLIQQKPIARQCRLYAVRDEDQSKAIRDIIQHIPITERLTITVENEQDDQCMFVMLFRENNETINDRYIEMKTTTTPPISNNSSDSAIAADDENCQDQQIASPIGVPQAESTHQYVDTTANVTGNQTIDFGENDASSTNTTIKDETDSHL